MQTPALGLREGLAEVKHKLYMRLVVKMLEIFGQQALKDIQSVLDEYLAPNVFIDATVSKNNDCNKYSLSIWSKTKSKWSYKSQNLQIYLKIKGLCQLRDPKLTISHPEKHKVRSLAWSHRLISVNQESLWIYLVFGRDMKICPHRKGSTRGRSC